MPSSTELYELYVEQMGKIADVRYALAVLQWDQETYLPPKGAAFRARQMATLSETAHQMFTADTLGSLLNTLHESEVLNEKERRNIELTKEDFDKQKKFTPSFVRKLSEATSASFHAWIEARKKNDFAVFEQPLEKLFDLKKQEAELLGYINHPYDALLNEHEKGCTVQMMDKIFGDVRKPLKDLTDRISNSPQVNDEFLRQEFAKQLQWDYGMTLIKKLGFDFDAGRQDISEHPFTTSFSPDDVRITTRVNEHDFSSMTWSCIHETGHALYEQGLPSADYGLPSGEFASLGIHESQSRLWENNVGRSLAFWKAEYPALQAVFPNQLSAISVNDFYRGINKVQPSFIRTEADELTYHFHVMIRYDVEKMLMEGGIRTSDIPAFWNEQYKKYLGLTVPDFKQGCLQDVHWSHGSLGYFPTYSLGSFYAAQLYAVANETQPAVSKGLESGNTQPLLEWLRATIHKYGRMYTSEELCRKATGKPLEVQYFLDYALDKYSKIYDL